MSTAPEQPRVLRKFIAGARCPACGQVDSLYVFDRDGVTVCACVDCGEIENPQPAKEAEQHAVAPEVVRIIEPVRPSDAQDGNGEHR